MNTFPPFHLEPFVPAPGLSSPHAQTIVPNAMRRPQNLIAMKFMRRRIELPDGDFLDIDFPLLGDLPKTAPLALLVHGLEGSARSANARTLYRELGRHGIRAVGLNLRSCSGDLNRLPQLYHAGATDDVAYVLKVLARPFSHVPLGLVGFSLGANMLLKYLGEGKHPLPPNLRAAVAISPPFDLVRSIDSFDHGSGRVYAQLALRQLKAKARLKAKQLEGLIDVEAVLAARTVQGFDDHFTAPLNGWRDAIEYYQVNSSGQFLPGITVPTLLLRSIDDPFFDPADIPYDAIYANDALYNGVVAGGGHVGFLGQDFELWAERQAARFFERMTGQRGK